MEKSRNSTNILNREHCVDELQIIRFALHKCTEAEVNEIKEHLLKCPLCFSELASIIKEGKGIKDEEIPAGIIPKPVNIERLKERIGKKLIIVMQIKLIAATRRIVDIIHQNGKMFQPGKMNHLREKMASEAQQLYIKKDLDGYQVKVDVMNEDEDYIDILVELTYKEGERFVPNVCFTLLDEKKQKTLQEHTEEKGSHLFEGVHPGEYSIKMAKDNKVIGLVLIDLKGP